jgi:hypothetical protein
MTTPEIAGAAGVLTEARFAADHPCAGHADATETTSRIAARIVALDVERAEIANARLAGVENPNHGSRLALMSVDRESLDRLLADAKAAEAAARAKDVSANAAVIAAEQALAAVTSAELLRRLVDHAGHLDRLLFATVGSIKELSAQIGRREPWSPGADLVNELRRLDLTRHVR